jgi:hypothetical protein
MPRAGRPQAQPRGPTAPVKVIGAAATLREFLMSPIKTFALMLCLLLPFAASHAVDSASGHYGMGDTRFEVAQGVAFRLWKDAELETYGVVIGEGPFDFGAAAGALDPIDAIASSAPPDSGTLLLTIRRDIEGSLLVSSLIARPDSFNTNGDGEEKIAVEGDRIRGEWTKPATDFFGRSYEMRVDFDLALTPITDPGQPLPADGGDPGKAYLAFLKVLEKREAKSVLALQALPEDMIEILGEESLLEIATMNHPTTAEVVGGWIDGERAQLRVKGTHAFGQSVRGRIEMKNVDGAWKVGDSALR